jgi:hypothetical protein
MKTNAKTMTKGLRDLTNLFCSNTWVIKCARKALCVIVNAAPIVAINTDAKVNPRLLLLKRNSRGSIGFTY